MNGLFFVFEGIDGSGKGVQTERLYQFIISRGCDAIKTCEPTDSEWGRKIREIAENGRKNSTPEEELEYFIKDRELHVNNLILPSLNTRKIVVCDRYYYSTVAYQGALGLDVEYLRRLNEEQYNFPCPTLVFYLEISPQEALARIRASRPGGANIGYERLEYLQKVKSIFDAMVYPYFIHLDGSLPPEVIAREIENKVEPLLQKKII